MEKTSDISPTCCSRVYARNYIHTHETCKMSTFSCTDDESNNNDEDFLTLYVDYMSQPSRACAMFIRYECS